MNPMPTSVLPLKPSPLARRDQLETMVLRDLLGSGTEGEELEEQPGSR